VTSSSAPLNSAGIVNTMLMSMPVGGGDPSLINGDSSSSSRSMSSSEAVGAGMSVFSFTLHSCLIGIIGWMVLKCSSLSFLTASSLIFYALIRWILLLWLGINPRGHQRGAGVVPGTVVLEALFCPKPRETGWSNLGNWTIRFGSYCELVPTSILVSTFTSGTLSCSTTTSSRLFSPSGFASSLAEVSLLGPIFPCLLLGSPVRFSCP
jgi:hypothetical protein